MIKTPPILDIYNYQKQHNIAVDMCVACIQHERKFNKPIKSIILSRAYFNIFKDWVRSNFDEETAELMDYFIDTVNIRCETIISGKSLLIEYYKPQDLN
jgi:hypothetical protein